jgi:tryptophan-rich sensory protein
MIRQKLPSWQLGLATLAVSVLGALSSRTTKRNERNLYEHKLEQAPWAPPPWAFGPAWTFNNYFLLNALNSLTVAPPSKQKRQLLALQLPIWLIYFTFGEIYFRKKSPVLAAIWTVTDAALAAASLKIALEKERKLALNFLPLTLWTSYASSIAIYQAIKNPDPIVQLS